MSRVNVDFSALADPRFIRLARYLGLPGGHHEALGRMIHVWMLATERGETHVGFEDLALAFGSDLEATEEEIVNALERADLVEVVADAARIRGAEGRIEL